MNSGMTRQSPEPRTESYFWNKFMLTARQLMTQPAITVRDTDTIQFAIERMLGNGISGLPVVGARGGLVGMLTEGDLLRRAEIGTEKVRSHWLEFLIGPGKLADEYTHAHSQLVRDVMSNQVIHAEPAASLKTLAELMQSKRIKRIPIVEKDQLIGVVGRIDLLRAISNAYATVSGASCPDSDIKFRLWSELRGTQWAPCNTITISVSDGVVTLGGMITDGRERSALCSAASNTAGVKKVHDHMTWVDLVSGTVIDEGRDTVVPHD